jgi:hypothetical protein
MERLNLDHQSEIASLRLSNTDLASVLKLREEELVQVEKVELYFNLGQDINSVKILGEIRRLQHSLGELHEGQEPARLEIEPDERSRTDAARQGEIA